VKSLRARRGCASAATCLDAINWSLYTIPIIHDLSTSMNPSLLPLIKYAKCLDGRATTTRLRWEDLYYHIGVRKAITCCQNPVTSTSVAQQGYSQYIKPAEFVVLRFLILVPGSSFLGVLFLAFGSWALCLLGVLGGSYGYWEPWEP
jgi:hypothetical protein